jgi:hypothetical protein
VSNVSERPDDDDIAFALGERLIQTIGEAIAADPRIRDAQIERSLATVISLKLHHRGQSVTLEALSMWAQAFAYSVAETLEAAEPALIAPDLGKWIEAVRQEWKVTPLFTSDHDPGHA